MTTHQNVMSIKANADSVLIDESNLLGGMLLKNYRYHLRNVKCWHKFVVSNTEGLARNQILKVVLDHLHPLDLIPVFFAQDTRNSNSYFLARNCEAAVEKLCKDNLTIEHPYSKNTNKQMYYKPFKITILLNYASTDDVKIDVQKNVLAVLNKRFDFATKTLNLHEFQEDQELNEFCPLSQPKIMYFVLHIAKNLTPEELILSNNGIKLLNPLDVLIGLKLRGIDLSNNELTSLNDLSSLKHFHLKYLKLSGNLLCDCEEEQYINRVRLLCPTVEILDGVPMNLDTFPLTKRYSFCDYDSVDLVNQFLEYFYTVYDSPDRRSLSNLYHTNAMFSLTCVYLAGQLSSGTAFLKLYSNISRNLKKASDFAKTSECLFCGRDNILNVFTSKIPLTEHDPYSFTADLMYKTDNRAVITVTGAFHEKPTSLLDKERFLGFSRTFALEMLNSKYVITNDQLHVYNGLTHQERNSFQEYGEPVKNISREFIPRPQAKSDYIDLVTTLSHLTNLQAEWARKCLEECGFDLKASLELFIGLFKGGKFPRNAFIDSLERDDESIQVREMIISPSISAGYTPAISYSSKDPGNSKVLTFNTTEDFKRSAEVTRMLEEGQHKEYLRIGGLMDRTAQNEQSPPYTNDAVSQQKEILPKVTLGCYSPREQHRFVISQRPIACNPSASWKQPVDRTTLPVPFSAEKEKVNEMELKKRLELEKTQLKKSLEKGNREIKRIETLQGLNTLQINQALYSKSCWAEEELQKASTSRKTDCRNEKVSEPPTTHVETGTKGSATEESQKKSAAEQKYLDKKKRTKERRKRKKQSVAQKKIVDQTVKHLKSKSVIHTAVIYAALQLANHQKFSGSATSANQALFSQSCTAKEALQKPSTACVTEESWKKSELKKKLKAEGRKKEYWQMRRLMHQTARNQQSSSYSSTAVSVEKEVPVQEVIPVCQPPGELNELLMSQGSIGIGGQVSESCQVSIIPAVPVLATERVSGILPTRPQRGALKNARRKAHLLMLKEEKRLSETLQTKTAEGDQKNTVVCHPVKHLDRSCESQTPINIGCRPSAALQVSVNLKRMSDPLSDPLQKPSTACVTEESWKKAELKKKLKAEGRKKEYWQMRRLMHQTARNQQSSSYSSTAVSVKKEVPVQEVIPVCQPPRELNELLMSQGSIGIGGQVSDSCQVSIIPAVPVLSTERVSRILPTRPQRGALKKARRKAHLLMLKQEKRLRRETLQTKTAEGDQKNTVVCHPVKHLDRSCESQAPINIGCRPSAALQVSVNLKRMSDPTTSANKTLSSLLCRDEDGSQKPSTLSQEGCGNGKVREPCHTHVKSDTNNGCTAIQSTLQGTSDEIILKKTAGLDPSDDDGGVPLTALKRSGPPAPIQTSNNSQVVFMSNRPGGGVTENEALQIRKHLLDAMIAFMTAPTNGAPGPELQFLDSDIVDPGWFLVSPQNEQSRKWLLGCEPFRIGEVTVQPVPTRKAPWPVNIFFHLRTQEFNIVRLRRVISLQNRNLAVDQWKHVSTKGVAGDWRVTFSVEQEVVRALGKIGWILSYELLLLPVRREKTNEIQARQEYVSRDPCRKDEN